MHRAALDYQDKEKPIAKVYSTHRFERWSIIINVTGYPGSDSRNKKEVNLSESYS